MVRAPNRNAWIFWAGLFLVVLLSRLCHSHILWADEDYHLAASMQVLDGKLPYRDIWYDKPLLNIAFYLLIGARYGWILTFSGALFVLACCYLAFRLARSLWTQREGYLAAAMLAFYMVFYFPGATRPLEPDILMIAPHLAAIYFACQKRPFLAGFTSGLAMLLNVKGVFVLASCVLFGFGSIPWLFLGFAVPNGAMLLWLASTGAVFDYFRQVWKWGFLYVAPFQASPTPMQGITRLLNWAGFHAVLVIGAGWFWCKDRRVALQMAGWTAISLVGAGLGWRFLPHYLNQLLPPLVICAARGMTLIAGTGFVGMRSIAVRVLIAISIAIPAVRFGPRYFKLARDRFEGVPYEWKDLAMEKASREAAQAIRSIAGEGDTIFIWGYWPKVMVYSGLPIASRFWDSQPLTGVPAERHSKSVEPVDEKWAMENRRELTKSEPDIVVEGLAVINPKLGIGQYEDLRAWFSRYCLSSGTSMTKIYRLCAEKGSDPEKP